MVALAQQWAVAAILTIALIITLWTPPWETPLEPEPQPPRRLSVELGAEAALGFGLNGSAILSPDESMLAFVGRSEDGQRQLYLHRMDQLEATLLSGTEGVRQPCFSPDSRLIAFVADDKLKKIAVTLCEAPNSRGIHWAEDGSIVFAQRPFGLYLRRGIFAAPFDSQSLELTGEPIPVLEEVRTNPNAASAQANEDPFGNTDLSAVRIESCVWLHAVLPPWIRSAQGRQEGQSGPLAGISASTVQCVRYE